MSNTLETLTNNMQERAERASRIAWERHRQGLALSARERLQLAEKAWEQWVYLKGLTRLTGFAEELDAMTRSEVMQ